MYNNMIKITVPSMHERIIVPHKSFRVEGTFDGEIQDSYQLKIELLDDKNNVVRHVYSNTKNNHNIYFHPELTKYVDEDLDNKKLKEFGFPELIVKDINKPLDSFKDATIKCFFNDSIFKAVITNETHGYYLDDGVNFTDENNNEYKSLQEGNYKIVAKLLDGNDVISKDEVDIKIGKLNNSLICRFNPKSHKEKVIKWADENKFSTLRDPAVGYLDSYLGEWKYHMGLLKMYRANDVVLYVNSNVHMFIYCIDETSTSYITELAYLQKHNLVNDKVNAYYYDLGEAQLLNRKANIYKFNDECINVCRVDVVNKLAKDNYFNLNEESLINTYNIRGTRTLNIDEDINRIGIYGVLKPIQFDGDNFILNKDNTYDCRQYYDKIIYTINGKEYERKVGLSRYDNKDIGNSVFEFYNVFDIDDKVLDIEIKVYDNLDNLICKDNIKVKKD